MGLGIHNPKMIEYEFGMQTMLSHSWEQYISPIRHNWLLAKQNLQMKNNSLGGININLEVFTNVQVHLWLPFTLPWISFKIFNTIRQKIM